jgi:8-oxo-dGTP pyrophosphatase MutT (NUDIX family)
MSDAMAVSLSPYAGRMLDVWTRLESLPEVAQPPKAQAAVLVPLYADDSDVRVIFTKRPDDMRTHPGDVVFPGGKMERDEGVVATALREADEEIRLPPSAVVSILGGLTPVTTRNRSNLIVPIVARVERPPELVADPSEVDVIIEPRLVDLLDEDRWRTNDWMGHTLWFYEFQEGILWGATAYMVRELLDYLRD